MLTDFQIIILLGLPNSTKNGFEKVLFPFRKVALTLSVHLSIWHSATSLWPLRTKILHYYYHQIGLVLTWLSPKNLELLIFIMKGQGCRVNFSFFNIILNTVAWTWLMGCKQTCVHHWFLGKSETFMIFKVNWSNFQGWRNAMSIWETHMFYIEA